MNVVIGNANYFPSGPVVDDSTPCVYSHFTLIGAECISVSLKFDLGLSDLAVMWPLYIPISSNFLVIPAYEAADCILMGSRFASDSMMTSWHGHALCTSCPSWGKCTSHQSNNIIKDQLMKFWLRYRVTSKAWYTCVLFGWNARSLSIFILLNFRFDVLCLLET